MVIVSHDRGFLERLATRAMVLDGGRLLPASLHRHLHLHDHVHIHATGGDHDHGHDAAGGRVDGEGSAPVG